jgi:pimeloyl-ACP methyl ester carboxylesterase
MDVSPEKSVAARAFRILLIFGLNDRKIPLRHFEAIFLAATLPKELWLVPDAGHRKAMSTAPIEFRCRALVFFSSADAAN